MTRTATGWTSSLCCAACGDRVWGALRAPGVLLVTVFGALPGLATEHFTVPALVRFVLVVYMMLPSASLTAIHYMRQTLMISAIIYSFEFVCASGLSEPPAPWWST